MSFGVEVDVKNPGQFFACCGLFELASRLASGTLARFEANHFYVTSDCTLTELIDEFTRAPLVQLDADDDTSSAIRLSSPFDMLVDWWKDTSAGGRELKVWAGTMQSVRIARAMVATLRDAKLHTEAIFDVGCVVYDPDDMTRKVEPFYFDARRAPNAHSRDIGFSPNDLDLTTTAFPAVEVFCLLGLQRCRPAPTRERRMFEYRTWTDPLPLSVVSPIVSGFVSMAGMRTYRFENWYRTGQKKHKAFRRAVSIGEGE
jgi:hypothetical protein